MENWVVYGVAASLLYGCSAIALKLAVSSKHYGVNPQVAALFLLLGIGFVFAAGAIFGGKFSVPKNTGVYFGILAGILWGLATLVSLKPIEAGIDIAKLSPIYNTNTLVAVVLGIILLNELPNSNEMIRVVLGAVLIVIGAIVIVL